jgi:hypothetical protein
MIRVVAWTGGLFAVGWGICHFFPGPFIEPLVLLALGVTLFFVSGRTPAPARERERDRPSDAVPTTRAAR